MKRIEKIEDFLAKDKGLLGHEEPLLEMAVLCRKKDGAGILVWVIYDGHPTPHAHVKDVNSRKEISIEITRNAPQRNNEVMVMAGVADDALLSKIVAWSKGRSKRGLNNWARLGDAWDDADPRME